MATVVPSMKELVGKYGSGADAYAGTVNAVNGLNGGTTQDRADAAINFAKVSQYFYELVSRANLPVLAQVLNLASLASNVMKANEQAQQRGYIEQGVYAGLISDVAAIVAVSAAAVAVASAAPVAIAIAGAAGFVGVYASYYGTTAGVREKAKEEALAEWGLRALDSFNAYGDLRWLAAGDANLFGRTYQNNPVLGPALILGHAVDRVAPVSTLLRVMDFCGSNAPQEGGQLAEAAAFLSAINQLLGGQALAKPVDLAQYGETLKNVYPAIKAAVDARPSLSLFAITSTNAFEKAGVGGLSDETLAYRYALANLNGFVAFGVDYSRFNSNGELTLDTESPNGQLSAAWLRDRVAMAHQLASAFEQDIARNPNGYLSVQGTSSDNANSRYVDQQTGIQVEVFANRPIPTTLPSKYTIFGTSGDDEISGDTEADRLYGGAGDDFLDAKAGNDYLEAGSGDDDLYGGDGNDTLLAGTGDDTLSGEAGNDALTGGAGDDTYRFDGAWGKDTLADSDDTGKLLIDGQAIGTAKGAGQRNVWVAEAGAGQYVGLAVYDDSSSATGKKLVITRQGSADNTITINNFDYDKAVGEGYLGIKLKPQQSVALLQGGGNYWGDFNADIANLQGQETTVAEGGGCRYTISLACAAKAGDTITLALTGRADKFKAILGDSTVTANGAVITLAEGQTQVSFALVQEGDLEEDGIASLSVSYQGEGQSATSNSWTVNLKDSGEIEETNTYTGDQTYATATGGPGTRITNEGVVTVVEAGQTLYVQDGQGNLQIDEAGVEVTDNTIYGTSDNDKIEGKTGNDALSGRDGHDELDGGDGDDLIGGGAGSDTINGGDGNDYISSSATIKGDRQQVGPTDQWTGWGLPAGKTATTHGATWGIYPDMQDGEAVTIWDGVTNTDTSAAGDTVDAGKGDDWVIASWAGDRVQGGEGDDQIDGLAGDDVLEGGDGADVIHGDGIQKTGFLNTVGAASHGADFIDGGNGDDKLTGGGGADNIFGGAGDDTIFADVGVATDQEEFIEFGFHGADYVDAEDGNDYAEGGAKDDTLYGGLGNDRLWGDQSANRLVDAQVSNPLAWGSDYLDGEEGDDDLVGGGKDDTLYGGAGKDKLWGDESNIALDGAANGSDYLDGEDDDDYLVGGGKGDTLFGGNGDDVLLGDDRQEDLAGEFHGEDYLSGEDGTDQLVGGGKDDVLLGGDGDDVLLGDDTQENVAGEFHGSDTLDGGEGKDQLTGGGKDDSLTGGAGDDVLLGDDTEANLAGEFHGSDILDAGDGDDQLIGGGKDDVLTGGAGADKLWGDDTVLDGAVHGVDQLDGGTGNDQLTGGGNADVLSGGDGDDLLWGDAAQDEVAAQFHGSDVLDGGAGNDQLIGGGLDDVLMGGAGNDTLLGDDVESSLAGADHGSDLLDGGDGDDFLAGGGGADQLYGGAGNDILQGDASLTDLAAQFNADDHLDGGDGDDQLFGGGGNDMLIGGAGNDRLNSGDGDDALDGGAGNDVFGILGALGVKTITDEGGFDVLQLGWRITDTVLGRGSLLLSNTATGAQVHVEGFNADDPDATSPIEQFEMTDASGSRLVLSAQELIARLGFSFDGTEADDLLTGTPFGDTLRGLQGDDTIHGLAGNDRLSGGAGDDTLLGDEGNDVLDAGTGSNTLVGGAGDDEYLLGPDGTDVVVELEGEGNDTVSTFASISLAGTHVENIRLLGSDAVNATGNDEANRIDGNAAANDLDGGAGLDTLAGGAGDDVYHVDSRFDVIVEAAGEGIDTVYSTDNRALGENVENLVLVGDALFGGGNSGANRIEGTDVHNELFGAGGDDTLLGLGGSDLLTGGGGVDLLVGGTGDDLYVANRFDTVVELEGEGQDGVVSNTSIDLSAAGWENVEDASLDDRLSSNWLGFFDPSEWDAYNVTGNALDNFLVGNGEDNTLLGGAGNDALVGLRGADVLNGGAGADYMRGGKGDDTYYVDNEGDVVEDSQVLAGGGFTDEGDGHDRVFATTSVTLGIGIEDATLLGSADLNATGNDEANALTGNAGANRLDGLAGIDALAGGAGDDIYLVDDAADQVLEAAGEGLDTVYAMADFTLGDNVENLVLQGDEAHPVFQGVGNELDNTIIALTQSPTLHGMGGNDVLIGNSGDDSLLGGEGDDSLSGGFGFDYLDGEAGADLMAGGRDDDTYVVDSQGDSVVEEDDAGTDTVLASVAEHTLGHAVENLTFTSEADSTGAGNELDNVITGNLGADVLLGLGGNDTLVGAAGADLMDGGAGDDTYYVDDAGDRVQETGGGGTDLVYSSASQVTLGEGIENLQIDGGLDGTGNALDNRLLGDASDNRLEGMDGNDMLGGGDGMDVLNGGAGADFLDGGAGADAMAGGTGDDVYVVDDTGDTVTELDNQGTDTVRLSGVASYAMGNSIEVLDGSGQRVALHATGNALDNTIQGGKRADVLSGGDGNDILTGGSFEVLLAGDIDPSVPPYIGQLIGDEDGTFGRGGLAAVEINNFLRDWNPGEGRSWETLVAQFGVRREIDESEKANYVAVAAGYMPVPEDVTGGQGFTVYWPRETYPIASQLADIAPDAADVLDGGAGDDVLDGGAGDDTLLGGDGSDVLRGGEDELGLGTSHYSLYEYPYDFARVSLYGTVSNNDHLDGGAGLDTMIGGSGNDTYSVDGQATANPDGRTAALDLCDTTNRFGMDEGAVLNHWVADTVVEAADQGSDTVIASASVVLDNVETVVLAETAAVRDIDAATGTGSQMLQGNSGNNRLDGGAGADSLAGGAGNDVYIVDDAGDTVTEAAGEGQDTVRTTLDGYMLAAHVETLVLEGSADISGTGNAQGNILIGNTGRNTLQGGEGADILAGWRGDDLLLGGAGQDTYVFARGDGRDVVDDAQESSTVHFSGDILRTDLSFQAQANDLVIYVGASDSSDGTQVTLRNWVNAAGRVEWVTFCADQAMALNESVLNQAPVAVADAAVAHEDGAAATGNVLANDSDPNAGDTLGVINAGVQAGQYGSLDLQATGDYVYTVDSASAQVQALGAGQHVQDTFAYTVTDNAGPSALAATSQLTVEVVGTNDGPAAHGDTESVSEDGVLSATGNVLANDSDVDTGDTLSVADAGTQAGEYGTLTLAADGAYSYSLNNGSTQVQALAAGQQVTEIFTYTVSDNHGATAASQLSVTVSGADEAQCGLTLTGTTKNDNLKGSDCADTIDGRQGADTMTGGKGDDTYFADTFTAGNGCDPAQGDKVVELANGGNDTVAASVSYVLPEHVENLMLLGSTKLSGTGNSGNNVIVGNAGASTLDGGAGNDVLVGRAAADVLRGGSGDDRLYGEGGSDKLYGGGGGDRLWGGAGNDVIDDDDGNNLAAGGAGDDTFTLGGGLDVVVAGVGNDKITTRGGNDFIDAGDGADLIDAGDGADFIAAGRGNDTITTGAGRDVIAFNRGDGQDIIKPLTDCSADGRGDLISLGGGIRYADLTLRKTGQDLVLGLGQGDQITNKDWYASTANRTVGAIQMVTQGGDYNPSSSSTLLNKEVVVFDFNPLVDKFDAARQANASLVTWAMQPALASALIGGTNGYALGGDLAYRYGTTYTTTQGLGTDMAVETVRTELQGQSAVNWQPITAAPAAAPATVDPWVALQAGTDLVVSQAPGASNPITPTTTPATDSLVIAALSASTDAPPSWTTPR